MSLVRVSSSPPEDPTVARENESERGEEALATATAAFLILEVADSDVESSNACPSWSILPLRPYRCPRRRVNVLDSAIGRNSL
jgi:hypothetical protein